MYDALFCARLFRTFNVVDDFNYEALSIENNLNLPASQVVAVLCRIAENHVYPAMIRMDYGQEFFDPTRTECAEKHVVKWRLPNQVSWRRTLLSRVLTGHTEQKYSVFVCSERWMKSGNWRQTGCQNITVNAISTT